MRVGRVPEVADVIEALLPLVGRHSNELNEVKSDVFRIRNETCFSRELLVQLAGFIEASEDRRARKKKGAIRSPTLISSAVRAAARYMRPRVSFTGNEADPLRLLFRLELQEDRLELSQALVAMEDSPLTSPEYEPEDGEVVGESIASSSKASGV
ncbi:hypothetical protein AURDEDRAFT_178109 [Auricularia subglabra TFB-10046 SS5]|uniref:Uncharacterized protein n=1 Tax=Auricularia subglabra (strain TFB-10046 / SS5) TaxID=717982 RepID=J0CRA7_AURST|nr:hypothetical protein AURDEDRAFT_178109 [Auricularia subglabra TFB-10046 SS5]